MLIKITRAFERTRQIADFVPIKAYCEVTSEMDWDRDMKTIEEASLYLAIFCESEVDKTLKNYYPMCIVCGGKGQKVNLNKEGMCGQCVSTMQFQTRDLKKETGIPKTKVV